MVAKLKHLITNAELNGFIVWEVADTSSDKLVRMERLPNDRAPQRLLRFSKPVKRTIRPPSMAQNITSMISV